jgi:hypothetical protein
MPLYAYKLDRQTGMDSTSLVHESRIEVIQVTVTQNMYVILLHVIFHTNGWIRLILYAKIMRKF